MIIVAIACWERVLLLQIVLMLTAPSGKFGLFLISYLLSFLIWNRSISYFWSHPVFKSKIYFPSEPPEQDLAVTLSPALPRIC